MGAQSRFARGKAGDSWGNLNEKEKQVVINAFKAKFPARYRKAIEEYYKQLQKGQGSLD